MKNRKYLYKLVTIILVGIFIPVLVALLFFMNRSFKRLNVDNEMYYEHSRNIMAIAIGIIILRLFAHFGTLIFSSLF